MLHCQAGPVHSSSLETFLPSVGLLVSGSTPCPLLVLAAEAGTRLTRDSSCAQTDGQVSAVQLC